MRRLLKASLYVGLALMVLICGVWGLANVDAGRRMIESVTASVTGGTVRIEGLSGRFPDALRIARATLTDDAGPYLIIEDVALDWSPTRLFSGLAKVDALTADRITLARLPRSEPASDSGGGFALPVRIALDRLRIDRLVLEAPVAGQAVSLTVEGSARVDSLRDARIDLTLIEGTDRYTADLRMTPEGLRADVALREAPNGLLARLASLPDIGAIDARLTANGPLDRLVTDLALAAGPLRASLTGSVDTVGQQADLTVSATAPAMTPRPDLGWRAVSLSGRVQGPFTAPEASATLRIEALAAGEATIEAIRADLTGATGHARMTANVNGLRLPGPAPDLLAAAPLTVEAAIELDQPGRPAQYSLRHPRFTVTGAARMDPMSATAHLAIPDLAPFASVAAVDIQGSTALDLTVGQGADATTATLQGTVSIIGGMDPLPALIGANGRIDVAATLQGQDVTLRRAAVSGRGVEVTAAGGLSDERLTLDWTARLSDIAALQPAVSGAVEARGRIEGPLDRFAVTADLTGDLTAQGTSTGRITAHLEAGSLPAAPTFRLTAEGALLDAPVTLSISGEQRDGTLVVDIDRSHWKSFSADGSLSLAAGAMVPTGRMQMRMTRLADLGPLLGRPLSGGLSAELTADAGSARAQVGVERLSLPGIAALDAATLDAVVTDPIDQPAVDATLSLRGAQAGGVAGSARLTAKGRIDAVVLALTTDLADLAGSPVQASAAATLRATEKVLDLTALRTTWKQQTITLLGPARVSFAGDVAFDRLRLGFGRAELAASGRVGETLELDASLRNLPADIASLFAPDFAADGTIEATVRLSGPTAQPNGSARVRATGLRLRQGPAASLPPGSLTLNATMQSGLARVDARAVVGRSDLGVTGTVPMQPGGNVDLRARGAIDLAMTDPLLTPSGRRARGRLALDIGLTGSVAAPRVAGSVQLSNGDVQDAGLGARVSNISATIRADGDTLRLASFRGQAGPGTIEATGSLGLADTMPVTLQLRANNARPLASDLLTVLLDADLNLSGAVTTEVALGGTVRIRRADLRIPERMPASVATIPVRIAGSPPPPPPKPSSVPAIGLALTLDAPEQVFVRGRGVDAELGGRITFSGTLADPRPSGGLLLRRGTLEIIGQTIRLSEGRVDFTGGGIADPNLRLVATSQRAGVTANAIISGRVRDPKVTLSSIPELPQDEVLAQLLFQSATARLSPFQIAQLAVALASLSGAPLANNDPLERMRKAVGLDRLTVGTDIAGRPVLEAGSYLADGVYVGTKQGAGGTGTQATIQVEIGGGVKLEATTGTGQTSATGGADAANSTSVGVTYQIEY